MKADMVMPAYNIISSVVLGTAGLLVAQLPDSSVPEWSRLGFSGACLAVALILATKTIPSILNSHRRAYENLSEKVEKGFDEVKGSIEKGDQQVAALLQSTLTQLIHERRGDGRNHRQ